MIATLQSYTKADWKNIAKPQMPSHYLELGIYILSDACLEAGK